MTIKELKEIIKDLPETWEILVEGEAVIKYQLSFSPSIRPEED